MRCGCFADVPTDDVIAELQQRFGVPPPEDGDLKRA